MTRLICVDVLEGWEMAEEWRLFSSTNKDEKFEESCWEEIFEFEQLFPSGRLIADKKFWLVLTSLNFD